MSSSPLAVYTDADDVDLAYGTDVLGAHGFRVLNVGSRDPRQILRSAADADALLVGYAEIDDELMAAMPNLRIISLLSSGHDQVDVAAATRRGIWVSTVGHPAVDEVATHAWMLALACTRRLGFFIDKANPRDWDARPQPAPRRLADLTVGIVGMGAIGSRVATLAAPGVRRVVGTDSAGLDEVLRAADILIVCLPLTPQTRGIIDDRALSLLPTGSHLINVSRGTVVDTDAVVTALESGRLAGAGLDVFDTEPLPADHPLTANPAVITTPHVAYLSDASEAEYVRRQADAVVSLWRDGTPLRAINDLTEPVSTSKGIS
ncbi:C-terminal binding protein [Gordonia jinhuaensis]|uniref:Dehydrogenase n=1 Tax=Gordonia jinhuaensis TaxID=1517702 RepID=A0A916SUZ0_9ACTN|nr:C-terminal binding protein [Gordonia jinhuaensis]GGB17941.1 dehydrogenase [Gordonia jinhuaensis]